MSGFLDFLLKTRSQPSSQAIADAGFPQFGGDNLDSAHIYPSDLFTPGNQPYMLLFVRDGVAQDAKIKKRLALYMPPTIQVSYGAQYQEIEMTLMQYQDIARDAANGYQQYIKGQEEYKQKLMTAGILSAGQLADYSLESNTNFGQQFQRILGYVVNPHMSLLFKGMDLRSFTFSFQMMARNQQESQSIQNIIKELKLAMHPSTTTSAGTRYLAYPDNFNIGLFSPNNDYLFNFNTCVLTGMNVDYAGSGIPSFFTETGAPVDIRINLTFKELGIVSREDIENRGL